MREDYEERIIKEAIKRGVSDIHFEPKKDKVLIRFRKDGILYVYDEKDFLNYEAILIRIKVKAGIDISDKRKVQSGRFHYKNDFIDCQIRISIMPLVFGEKMAFRIIKNGNSEVLIEELGFTEDVLMELKKINSYIFGLFIFSGSTGSGKTTTQIAILKKMKAQGKNIIMIEEPIEYFFEEANQIEVNRSIGFDYDLILRETLRQDPDIIVIGEIRDTETAKNAVTAARTGHLVFATLHTASTYDAIHRFIELGVSKEELFMVLKGIINQRLIRKTCELCNGRGCFTCNKTGFDGRFAVGSITYIEELLKNFH